MEIFKNLLGAIAEKVNISSGNRNKKIINKITKSIINAPVQQAETIVNHGPVQRYLSEELKKKILGRLSLEAEIGVCPSINDRETLTFTSEIIQFLKSQKYNVRPFSVQLSYVGDSELFGDGIRFIQIKTTSNKITNPLLPDCCLIIE